MPRVRAAALVRPPELGIFMTGRVPRCSATMRKTISGMADPGKYFLNLF
jgi:hypothetical protein